MSTEPLTFFLVTVVLASLVLVAVLLLPGERRSDPERPTPRDERLPAKYSPPPWATAGAEQTVVPSPATYDRVLRIVWWVTIVGVLIGVGLSGAFPETRSLIFGLGLVAVGFVLALHEFLPERWITPLKFAVEAVAATALITALLALTGYGSSPYFFGYYLVAVGVALTLGRRATLLYAAVSALAYAGVLLFDPQAPSFASDDLLRFSVNIGSVWLLAFLAAVFAGEERRARTAVQRLSVTDPLTGLFNRAQIHATLEQEIQRTRRSDRGFCMLMIDLDGLKAVNDSLGHHRGDDVLRALARVITRSIRTVDTAARYGGDEFVVLLPETEPAGALVVAEKIRTGAEELSLTLENENLTTSVSIGLVYHPDDGTTVDELMIAADRAMYASKALGKNQVSSARDRRQAARVPALTRASDGRSAPAAAVAVEPASAPAQAAAAMPAPTPPAEPILPNPMPEEDRPAEPTRVEPIPGPPASVPSASVEPAVAAVADAPPTNEVAPSVGGNGAPGDESDEEPDAAETRRRISQLSYDPDDQVRRAMDAFLSPVRPSSEETERRPD